MKEDNNKVVYLHRKKSNGEVFYVGIGTSKRPYIKQGRNIYWKRTVNKHGLVVEVIRTGLSWEDACDIEQDLIELIGRRELGLGTLVNLTSGGKGPQTYNLEYYIKTGLVIAKYNESKFISKKPVTSVYDSKPNFWKEMQDVLREEWQYK